MKQIIKLILSAVMCLSIVSCTPKLSFNEGEILKCGKTYVDKGTYLYLAATYKAAFLETYNSGFDTENFYNNTVEKDGKTITYGQYIESYIKTEISRMLVSANLFDEYNLELSDDVLSEIDNSLDELTDYESIDDINYALSNYCIDYNALKDIKLFQAKSDALFSYLFEGNGEKAPNKKEFTEYIQNSYRAIGLITIYSDKEYVLDENGENTFNENGTLKTRPLNDEEKSDKLKKIKELSTKIDKYGYTYNQCLEYSDEDYSKEFPLGILVSASDINAYGKEIIASALSMKPGDHARIEDNGITYFVFCLEMPDFEKLSSSYDITDILYNCTLDKYNKFIDKKVKKDVVENIAALNDIDIEKIKQNVFY